MFNEIKMSFKEPKINSSHPPRDSCLEKTLSEKPLIRIQSMPQSCEKPNNRVKQTHDVLSEKERSCTGFPQNKRHFEIKSNEVIQRDYSFNLRIQTTYQRHFNNTADVRLGYCSNRPIEERHRYFKGCQRFQDHALQMIKLRNASSAGKYKSNKSQRISEYMAETSHIGGAIMKSGIHNHLKCANKNCTHFITFR
ncbi:uncharacterized protein LOC119073650 [Bradysia coprophila]|uniref:uncharacterized protein LOC119073650 n=1 Tax=Bradysia coprophila TaxID=38358 RepID=UPI00187D8CC7|nr:uncharacterized protein LOC119073650 [Bradysia coprophila]